jgi:hypothetical protein
MLLSADNALKTLPNCCWFASLANVMALAMVCFSLFSGLITINAIIVVLALGAVVGFAIGLYVTYRSDLNSTTALNSLIYLLLVMGFMFAGGFAAFLPKLLGQSEMIWTVFLTFAGIILIFLLIGIYSGAKTLGWPQLDQKDIWNSNFNKIISYSTHKITPGKIQTSVNLEGWPTCSFALVGMGMNIPLLFELFSGDRFNAIFLVIPLLTAIWGYLNIFLIGPSFAKIASLRKLEKSLGYRFINADYEQIQELRRTFFLSRWLMKDYVKPAGKAVTNDAVQRK